MTLPFNSCSVIGVAASFRVWIVQDGILSREKFLEVRNIGFPR